MIGVIRPVLLVLFLAACVLGFVALPLSTIAYDLPINYAAAWDLRHGGHLYDPPRLEQVAQELGLPRGPHPFTTLFASNLQPPLSTLLHLPLTFLPYDAAKVVFLGVNLGLLGLALWLGTRDRGQGTWDGTRNAVRGKWGTAGLVVVTLALGYRELVMTLHLGQTNIWVLACMAGSLWALERRRWWLVGLLVATATGLKLLPGVAILWLLARGQVRPAMWALGLLAAFFAATLVVLGPDTYVRYYQHALQPTSNGSAHFLNMSLLAALMRVVLPVSEWTSPNAAPALEWVPVVRAMVLLVGAIVLGWALWSLRTASGRTAEKLTPIPSTSSGQALTLPHRGGGDRLTLELGLVLSIAVLFSPIAWEHYLVWLLFAVPAASGALSTTRMPTAAWVVFALPWRLAWMPVVGSALAWRIWRFMVRRAGWVMLTDQVSLRDRWVLLGALWVLVSVPTEVLAATGVPPLTWVRTMGLLAVTVLLGLLLRSGWRKAHIGTIDGLGQ